MREASASDMSALPVPALLLLFLLPTGSILRHATAYAPARDSSQAPAVYAWYIATYTYVQ